MEWNGIEYVTLFSPEYIQKKISESMLWGMLFEWNTPTNVRVNCLSGLIPPNVLITSSFLRKSESNTLLTNNEVHMRAHCPPVHTSSIAVSCKRVCKNVCSVYAAVVQKHSHVEWNIANSFLQWNEYLQWHKFSHPIRLDARLSSTDVTTLVTE